MKRKANRQVSSSANDGFNADERENIKRICLAFNKVGNVLMQLHPLFDSVAFLSDLTDKAKGGRYFIKIGHSGEVLPTEADQSLVCLHGVHWQKVMDDLNAGYAHNLGIKLESNASAFVLPEKVADEISYEFERQDIEVQNANKRVLAQKRMVASKGKTQKLLELNDQPLFPGTWRKEAFAPRVYVEKLEVYKGAVCVEENEKRDLEDQLRTGLAGFQGPAYNYDDHDLTERWMKSFEDSAGSIVKASEDEIIRNQVENLMENLLGKVQDDVCNDNKVLTAVPPLGLGPAMVEREVWGIDCHTRRMLELILNEALGGIGVENCSGVDGANLHEEIKNAEGVISKNKSVTHFLEKTLLVAINAVPESQAHKMDVALKHIIDSPDGEEVNTKTQKKYASILLAAMADYSDNDEHFRIHPKGTGVICTSPQGIAPHVVITDYLGEMYPPYRWCEKLEIIERAQREYDMKPGLPEFHNILLERPRKDENGYGLIYVDASQRGNMGSTCSHSCDANCTSAVVARDGKLVIVLTTNRYVHPGEELCMDYFSVTSSEVEWRAAICLCGSVCCRGSFLHLATQDDLQQVLNQKCGPLYRVASLLRACSDKPLSDSDSQTLQLHGMGKYGLGGNTSQWLQKYAAETLRFVEFERQALPCALIRQSAANAAAKSKRNKNKTEHDGSEGDSNRPQLSFTQADMEARSVMEQRLQSLVCCFSMVSKFLASQTQFQRDTPPPPPMSVLPALEAIDAVWKILQPIPRLMHKHMIQNSTLKTTKVSKVVAGKSKPRAPRKNAKKVTAAAAALASLPDESLPPSSAPTANSAHVVDITAQAVTSETSSEAAAAAIVSNDYLPSTQPHCGLHLPAENVPTNNSIVTECPLLPLDQVPTVLLDPCHVGTPVDSISSASPEKVPAASCASSITAAAIATAPDSTSDGSLSDSLVTAPPLASTHVPAIPAALPQPDPSVIRIEDCIEEVKYILDKERKPKTLTELRNCIGALQRVLSQLHDLASSTARLRLLTDVLSMWKNTSNFVRVQEFTNVESGPIEVVARELASTTINKEKYEEIVRRTATAAAATASHCGVAGTADGMIFKFEGNGHTVEGEAKSSSGGESLRRNGRGTKRSKTANGSSKAAMIELGANDVVYTGTKQYSNMFAFWQVGQVVGAMMCDAAILIGWYYAGTDQEAICPDLFGTCMLPTPNVCFGISEDSYSSSKRDKLYEHLCNDQSQAMPWPADIRKCFTTKLQSSDSNITAASILGSPVLDTHLGQVDAIDTCLDEMFGAHRTKKYVADDDADAAIMQLDGILPPEENTGWVQCDACMKWRRVPWNVNTDTLPENWYCKDNFWDTSERASCDASQDQFNPDKESTVFDVLSDPEPCAVGDLKDVFCMRNEVFYEAKVMKIRPAPLVAKDGQQPQAMVKFHFMGWKKNTDEWLPADSTRITPHHRHTDVTVRNPRAQEKWQGRKNLVNKAGEKRKTDAPSISSSKASKKGRKSKL